MITFRFTGGAEIEQALIKAGEKIAKNTVRRGLDRAADVVVEEAQARAPRRSGGLARSIGKGSPRPRPDGTVTISVGTRGRDKDGEYHHFLGLFFEYGVAPHYLQGGDGLSARKLTQRVDREGVLKIDGALVSGPVLHPGLRPRPFLRPALDASAERVVTVLRDYLASELASGGYLVDEPEGAEA